MPVSMLRNLEDAPLIRKASAFGSWRGGCNCKLGPAELQEILSDLPFFRMDNVIAGLAHSDDAAVCRLPSGQLLVVSVDFQNPVVGDYKTAGAISAANAMSDIYAMGFTPQFANAILSVSETEDVVSTGRDLMKGMAEMAADAQCALVGGHTFLGLEALCGLAVYAIGEEKQLKLKSHAKPGDLLILTKPIGTGILTAAANQGYPLDPQYLQTMLTLNRVGALLGRREDVGAMTDISGFGLAGHACEIAHASDVTLEISMKAVPLLSGAMHCAMDDVAPVLGQQTLAHWAKQISFEGEWSFAGQALFADPQTNGGLLISVRPEGGSEVLNLLHREGATEAAMVGRVLERCAADELVIARGMET